MPHYQEIERLLPDNPQSHLALGPVWMGLGRPDETIREYREAMRLDPQSPEAQTRLAWVLATCADPNLRNGAEAEELAKSACDLTNRQNRRSRSTPSLPHMRHRVVLRMLSPPA